jgi:toxin ParE1/3/4
MQTINAVAKAHFSHRAKQDLRDIWQYVALDSPREADKLLSRILDKIDLAAFQPGMGSARPELSASARILVEGRHIVIYEPVEYGIFIVAIVHGARDAANWL